jgi:hypothetical protein
MQSFHLRLLHASHATEIISIFQNLSTNGIPWTKCTNSTILWLIIFRKSRLKKQEALYLGGFLDFGLVVLSVCAAIACRSRSLKVDARSTERASSALI